MLWGITQREIFENMLRLMRFGVYFEITLKIKWLFSYRNNYSIYSYTHICFMDLGRGGGGGSNVTKENFENMVRVGV